MMQPGTLAALSCITQPATVGTVQRKSFADVNCSVAQCLEIVGERWTLLIVRDLFFGVSRFDVFEARLGIARNVLTQRLQHLVEHGVIERIPYQQNPVRYDYVLTAKGRDLAKVVTAMREWGDRWAAPDGPPVVLVHDSCGEPTTMVPHCSHCGERLRGGQVHPEPGPGAADRRTLPV
jgi:DNA-binding HxlR family transcriptional regulator